MVIGADDARSDAELVTAVLEGDRSALGALVGRHRSLAFALARRLLGEEMLADDAVQEATAAAITGLGRLRSPERFGAWYAGIALNVARRMIPSTQVVVPPRSDLVDDRPGPEEQAEAADLARRVRQAVSTLPKGQREAILSFYWQGLTHAEAAAELGITRNAIKARLHQARAALSSRLADHITSEKEVPTMTISTEESLVDVEVVDVRRRTGDDPARQPHVIVLKELDGERTLPIYTGRSEAVAMASTLEAVDMPRPMTYQMAARLLEAARSSVIEVRVTRLVESTFYATVMVSGRDGQAEVDVRPSDALNLALVTGSPIRVEAKVFDETPAGAHDAWKEYTIGVRELAVEVQETRDAQAEHVAESRGSL